MYVPAADAVPADAVPTGAVPGLTDGGRCFVLRQQEVEKHQHTSHPWGSRATKGPSQSRQTSAVSHFNDHSEHSG